MLYGNHDGSTFYGSMIVIISTEVDHCKSLICQINNDQFFLPLFQARALGVKVRSFFNN